MYEEVLEGIDLTYEVQKSSVKETLVLGDIPGEGEAIYRWILQAPGLQVEETEDLAVAVAVADLAASERRYSRQIGAST